MTKQNRPTNDETLKFLHDVGMGHITLTPLGEVSPQKVYAGTVLYKASNGWSLTVFNDCGEWDYIETIEKEGHWSLEFEDLEAFLHDYRENITDEVAWERYRIPGYLKFRCETCGTYLDKDWRLNQPAVCDSCSTLKSKADPVAAMESAVQTVQLAEKLKEVLQRQTKALEAIDASFKKIQEILGDLGYPSS